MNTHIVLLRAVNVGGHGKISMADIRACLTGAGFSEVRTLLQSGNVVVGSQEKKTEAVEKKIQAALLKQFSLKTEIMVRTVDQWNQLIAGNPFSEAAKDDPSHLVAMVTKNRMASDTVKALRASVSKMGGNEQIGFHDGQLYATYPDGIGDSKLTSTVIERATQCPVTARNWNTVLKLAAMCAV